MGGLCPTHGALSCERCRATGQGVANCYEYGHTGHPRVVGAPTGQGLYVTRPGMRRLLQTERVCVARGMHGQDAPLALSPVAQERDNPAGLGGGKKRASEQGLTAGAQRRQKHHKATKDAEGGAQPKDHLPPC